MEQKNLILGFDFGKNISQFCRYDRGAHTAVSVPAKEGIEQIGFPTRLAKAKGKDLWKTGLDLEEFVKKEQGILIENLYEICMDSRTYQIEETEYTPGQLLAAFLADGLKRAGAVRPDLQISVMMITSGQLTRPFVENVREAYQILGIPRGRAYLQEHDESFFAHTMYQRPELWSRRVGLFVLKPEEITFSTLMIQRGEKKNEVVVKQGPKTGFGGSAQEKDREFSHLIQETVGNEIYSSIYLVGEEFDVSWASQSLNQLKKSQRRIFGGSNLFALGACLSAKEKIEERQFKGYQFRGNDLVRYQIGMDMVIQGSPAHYVLIRMDTNWYEAEKECEMILDGTEDLIFVVKAKEDGKKKKYTMHLEGIPKRPPRTTRIRLRLEFDSPRTCQITAEDLGFGDMFPASHKIWHETMEEV